MKSTLVVIGLVALMVAGVTYAFAQGRASGPGYGPGYSPGPRDGECPGYGAGPGKAGFGPGMRQKGLDLTDDQKTRFQELRQKFNDETAALRKDMFTKRQELHALWTDSTAKDEAIMAKDREMTQLRDQMRDKMLQFKLEARTILTPDQLGKFESFGPGMGPGHGRRGGKGGCGENCLGGRAQ